LAGLAANPPQSAVFDRPGEGIGNRIGKVQKRAFGEINVLRAKGLERRTDTPPLQTSGAWPRCFRPAIVFANSLSEGAPLRSAPFSNDEFQTAAQTRFGVRLTCLRSSTNLPLRSNAFATDKFVGAFGNTTKSLWEQRVEARWYEV